MDKEKLFAQIKGGLIVSCQALEHEPLYTKEGGVMPLMAKAAAMSGAVGIRANTVRDITQIKAVVDLPVIGIIKKDYPGTPMYITVTMKEVDELVACGVDILAVQGTGALRPDGSTSAEFIRAIKAKYPDQLLMADCDNFENAMACAEAGADFVGTTMRGYTPETQGIDDIDFAFVHKLAAECPAKIIAEGHIHYPEQAVKALEAEYGRIWAFDMANCSDVHYFYFGFHDPLSDFAQSWNSVPAGFDTKFLCDCGQYRGLSAFKAACEWTLGSDGKVRAGFVYNDSSDAGLCSDRVSTGGDVFFRNIGSVGNSMSDDDNGRRYSYLAKARNVDESKCRDCGEAGSIEEFSVRRAAEGGLAPGDWFTLARHVAVNGETRVECVYPLWDGEKWIDYETERPVRA